MGGSALFASRFRECAARALLLPRRHPGRRSPLWHQRQRAAQLLDVARKYPDFPIVLETVRECLQDVYDVPTLAELMADIAAAQGAGARDRDRHDRRRSRRRCCSATSGRSCTRATPRWPSAAPRRSSLDSTLLAELLGRVELRELLDPGGHRRDRPAVAAPVGRPGRPRRRGGRGSAAAAGPADRRRGRRPRPVDGADVGGWLEGLRAARRALTVSFAGRSWWVAIEDIGRLRDGVGVAVPVGVPASFTEEVADPLGELLGRYARTHTPFTTADAAARFGLGLRVTADVLGRLAADGRLVRGDFVAAAEASRAPGTGASSGATPRCCAFCGARSLAALRAQVEPVSTAAYARFLPAWHRVGAG